MKDKKISAGKPAKRSGVRPRAAGIQSHEVRIIGGLWKRTKLKVADRPGLRPTPDRVRETVFNWLGQDLTAWRCVDAFAGTGVLGFEAASRGAVDVMLVEQDSALVLQLQRMQAHLNASAVRVVRGEGVSALRQLAPGSQNLIFLDPPFDGGAYDTALAAAAKALSPQGFVYLEAPVKWADEQLAATGLVVYRYLKAGAVHAHLLQKPTNA